VVLNLTFFRVITFKDVGIVQISGVLILNVFEVGLFGFKVLVADVAHVRMLGLLVSFDVLFIRKGRVADAALHWI
jgi:hypothetical protein